MPELNFQPKMVNRDGAKPLSTFSNVVVIFMAHLESCLNDEHSVVLIASRARGFVGTRDLV